MSNEKELYIIDKDTVFTPYYIVDQIFKLINISSYDMVWFPFDSVESYFPFIAKIYGLNYLATYKYDDMRRDFFTTEPPKNCDLLISNPPFSIQNDILKRCFDLIDSNKIKSFVLLLPLYTLETCKRANLFEKYIDKLSIIIFKKRITFRDKSTPFNTGCCWICYNVKGLPSISWI